MKIIDILTESAELLGLKHEVQQLKAITAETETEGLASSENISSLFNLVKFSIRELCTNYVPVISSKTINLKENSFPVAELDNYIRIQAVYKNGYLIKHKVINRNIVLDDVGEIVVNYATYPEINSLFDEIDFLQNFSPDVIVFGLCSYFSVAHGMFEDFSRFHERYIDKAESIKGLKVFNLPNRRWEWK